MEEIQEDPKRDALIDALMEEIKEYIVHLITYGSGDLMYEVHKDGLKDRLKEILDHERDRVKV